MKTWEWENEGLKLKRIIVLDDLSKSELMTIDEPDLPFIYVDPLDPNPYVTYDKISNYYLSIQLPIPLNHTIPATISHRFILRDTVQHKDVTVEGGLFSPRLDEVPIVISSPVKGDNWLFTNQSTNDYHFFCLFFVNGIIGRGERFAFDNVQLNDEMEDILVGDPKVNESYCNYKDTLYAVADGKILTIKRRQGEEQRGCTGCSPQFARRVWRKLPCSRNEWRSLCILWSLRSQLVYG